MSHTKHHFRDLLLAICAFLVSYPFLVSEGLIGKTLEAVFGLMILRSGLLAAPGYNHKTPVYVWIALCCLVSAWAGEIMAPDNAAFSLTRYFFLIFFFGRFIFLVGRDVFVTQRIDTTNRLYGAICIYLLLATLFADLYLILETLEPDSFSCASALCNNSTTVFHDGTHLYFSLITLATVGYGDITPTQPIPAMVSAMEALLGQMYIGIVIARLVGLHLLEASKPTPKA